jgi:hypothetical protein
MIGKERQLPSEHESARKKIEEEKAAAEERNKQEAARVRQSFDKVLATEEGKVMWKWFFDRLGYNKSTLMRRTDGEIAEVSTECLSAIRNAYLDARKLVSVETLVDAELYAEHGIVIKKTEEKGEK